MNVVSDQINDLVKEELHEANQKHPLFHSSHEAWAVLKEEVEELREELEDIDKYMEYTFRHVRMNFDSDMMLKNIRRDAINAAAEAIQVAAMAEKYMISQKQGWQG